MGEVLEQRKTDRQEEGKKLISTENTALEKHIALSMNGTATTDTGLQLHLTHSTYGQGK